MRIKKHVHAIKAKKPFSVDTWTKSIEVFFATYYLLHGYKTFLVIRYCVGKYGEILVYTTLKTLATFEDKLKYKEIQ